MVINEVDVGYKVTVGKVFDASGTADESGDFVVLPEPGSYVKDNTQYLVTLDVNGANKLYRELWTSGSMEDNTNVPLSDYTYVMDEYAITGLTEDDAVVVRFEEVEVKTSDAFRAAVSKSAPKSEGVPAVEDADKGKYLHANESTGDLEWATAGGSGGGVLVVKGTWDEEATTCTLDKTWQEINDGGFGVVEIDDPVTNDKNYCPIVAVSSGHGVYFVHVIYCGDTLDEMMFSASSASGYPTYTDE